MLRGLSGLRVPASLASRGGRLASAVEENPGSFGVVTFVRAKSKRVSSRTLLSGWELKRPLISFDSRSPVTREVAGSARGSRHKIKHLSPPLMLDLQAVSIIWRGILQPSVLAPSVADQDE